MGARQDLDVVPVAVPPLESLDAAGDIRPIAAGNIDVGPVRALAEDECSPRGIHVGVHLTLSKEGLVHGFGGAVPAVLSLRHAVGVRHESLASIWAEQV